MAVFPADSGEVCGKLGLRYLREEAYRADFRHIDKAFRIARTVVAHARGQEIEFDDDGLGVTLSGGEPRCLRAARALRLVKAGIQRAGLDDEFKVRVHDDVRTSDCITEARAASLSDAHTIELQTEEIAYPRMHEPTPAEDRAAREEAKHQCDHPLGRAGAKAPEDIHDVIICAMEQDDDWCIQPQALKALVERALRREKLSDWDVKVVDRHPRPGRRYVSSRSTDSRVRQVVIVLGGKCPAFP